MVRLDDSVVGMIVKKKKGTAGGEFGTVYKGHSGRVPYVFRSKDGLRVVVRFWEDIIVE